MAYLTIAGEGTLDIVAARKIAAVCGHVVIAEYPKGGKSRLDPQIPGYARAAVYSPWFVLRDLDHDAPCPGALAIELVTHRPDGLILRVAVRSLKSWLLADNTAIARYLGVRAAEISSDPESLEYPKQSLVNIARRSRWRRIRDALVPEAGLSTSEGPGYNIEMSIFARDQWDPERAAKNSLSLERCISALCSLPAFA
jgi:hypothetical protein